MRIIMLSLLISLLAGISMAKAGSVLDSEPYSDDRLAELQSQGAPVLVKVRADWCRTCAHQRHALAEALDHPRLDSVRVLRLDWDEQSESAEALEAWRQSTLIMYAGDREVGRSVAETEPDRLRHLVAQAFACG